jgi:hypothetical protein
MQLTCAKRHATLFQRKGAAEDLFARQPATPGGPGFATRTALNMMSAMIQRCLSTGIMLQYSRRLSLRTAVPHNVASPTGAVTAYHGNGRGLGERRQARSTLATPPADYMITVKSVLPYRRRHGITLSRVLTIIRPE